MEMSLTKNIKEVNFMDFCENVEVGRLSRFSRPLLSTDKQVIYQDDQRGSQVLDEMHRFYQDERLCDVVLKVDDVKFACHRLVLAASSLYFERMFSNDMTESRASEVRLKNVSSCALKYLIEFAYASKLAVCKDTALEIFEAADMLAFPTARRFCQDFLMDQVDQNNCLNFIVYADHFACDALYEKAKLCAATFFQTVKNTPEFVELTHSHLEDLLKEDTIELEYEEHIYEAFKKWILYDIENRRKHIPKLFKCVRLNFVSRWYLIEVVSSDDLIFESHECRKMIQSAKDQLLAQGHTYDIPWQLPPSRKCTGLTWKLVYINTYDPNPGESEIFLFDVVNKSWSTTSKPCPLASEFSTCETLGDALLVVGGWSSSQARSLNQRGAVNMIHEFKVMPIFPTLWYVGAYPIGISRYLHSTVRAGCRLYLIGGYDETQSLQASVFVTHADNGYRFEVCTRMLYPVYKPAVAHWDKYIYVFGGFGEGGMPWQHIQQFDMVSEKWVEIKPSIEGSNMSCQFAEAIGNTIFVVCGDVTTLPCVEHSMVGHRVAPKCIDSIHGFNPLTNQWQSVYKLRERRTNNFSIAVLNGKIYITGGIKSGIPYHAVDCYDPLTGIMETVGNIREGPGCLSLCTTMKVMHENFGL